MQNDCPLESVCGEQGLGPKGSCTPNENSPMRFFVETQNFDTFFVRVKSFLAKNFQHENFHWGFPVISLLMMNGEKNNHCTKSEVVDDRSFANPSPGPGTPDDSEVGSLKS